MYVQGYTKKELFINFFSLQPLQAILFLQYLQFSKGRRAGEEEKIFVCTAQTHHQKQTNSREENMVLSLLQRQEYLV